METTAERSCPCEQPACPDIVGGEEITSKPLVSRLHACMLIAWKCDKTCLNVQLSPTAEVTRSQHA
ncbi:hypothetical protein J6590_019163 [Homalodisca vitripennis]|nr:hypothetical protein J6590_019163 [Homalodisca vitripennis]